MAWNQYKHLVEALRDSSTGHMTSDTPRINTLSRQEWWCCWFFSSSRFPPAATAAHPPTLPTPTETPGDSPLMESAPVTARFVTGWRTPLFTSSLVSRCRKVEHRKTKKAVYEKDEAQPGFVAFLCWKKRENLVKTHQKISFFFLFFFVTATDFAFNQQLDPNKN